MGKNDTDESKIERYIKDICAIEFSDYTTNSSRMDKFGEVRGMMMTFNSVRINRPNLIAHVRSKYKNIPRDKIERILDGQISLIQKEYKEAYEEAVA
jgi:hypothetical protein